jgi:hypothetical protein
MTTKTKGATTRKKAPSKRKPAVKRKAPARKKAPAKRKAVAKAKTPARKGTPPPAPIGNKYWMRRSTHGAPRRYTDPNELWADCVDYFQWVDDNPLTEVKVISFQGDGKAFPVDKMRPMTIGGLCCHIGVSLQTWHNWRNERPDLLEVITRAEMVMTEQKFAGAAADLLNANIISRDLGLVDRRETELGNKGDEPLRIETVRTIQANMTAQEALEIYRETLGES